MTDSSTTSRMQRTAIVLGGGGVAGIAWQLGLLDTLLDAGIPLGNADLVVGTSAGSVVGALLRFGGIERAYREQLEHVPASYREPDQPDWDGIADQLSTALQELVPRDPDDEREARAQVGELARTITGGQTEEERVATIAELLQGAAREGAGPGTLPTGAGQEDTLRPDAEWPDAPLGVCAVDVEDGAFRVFSKDDDVPLTRALAASCAVPLVWSPVTIDGRSYMDGGARSTTNVDVAAGFERVLVVASRPEDPTPTGPWLDRAVQQLRANGTAVHVIVADEASRAAYGDNVLSVSSRTATARMGRAQAARITDEVRAFWAG